MYAHVLLLSLMICATILWLRNEVEGRSRNSILSWKGTTSLSLLLSSPFLMSRIGWAAGAVYVEMNDYFVTYSHCHHEDPYFICDSRMSSHWFFRFNPALKTTNLMGEW